MQNEYVFPKSESYFFIKWWHIAILIAVCVAVIVIIWEVWRVFVIIYFVWLGSSRMFRNDIKIQIQWRQMILKAKFLFWNIERVFLFQDIKKIFTEQKTLKNTKSYNMVIETKDSKKIMITSYSQKILDKMNEFVVDMRGNIHDGYDDSVYEAKSEMKRDIDEFADIKYSFDEKIADKSFKIDAPKSKKFEPNNNFNNSSISEDSGFWTIKTIIVLVSIWALAYGLYYLFIVYL